MDIELLELRELAKARNQEKKDEWIEPLTDPNVYCLLVFFGLALAFLLSGCQGEVTPLSSKYIAQEGTFKALIYPDVFKGKQGVSLQWSYPKEKTRGWFVRRMNLRTNETVLYVRNESTHFLHDEDVPPGKYMYELTAYYGKEDKRLGSLFLTLYPLGGMANE